MRDVAFVEMGHSWYRLIVYLDDDLSAGDPSTGDPSNGDPSVGIATRLRSSMESALIDSNVRPEVVTVGKNATEESLQHLQTLDIQSHPSAVLVSPEGHVRQIPLPAQTSPLETPLGLPLGSTTADALQENIQSAIDSVVHSPRRDEILSELMTAHSLVLIIESQDREQNLLAKSMVENAIGRIEATLPELPKPIDVPPRMIVISPEEARREAIMLWSLGVDIKTNADTDADTDTDADRATQIAMVFGRGRKLGSAMNVTEIGEQELLRTLAVVGLDCECDLDRSWMQTPMFPHAWTEADEAQAVKSLGFDPGHPLVKVEISRILSRGPSSLESPNASENHGQSRSISAAADMLLPGLQIIELDFDDDPAPVEAKGATGGTLAAAQANSPVGSDSERKLRTADSAPIDSAPINGAPIGSAPIGGNGVDDNTVSSDAVANAPINGDAKDDRPIDLGHQEPASSATMTETVMDASAGASVESSPGSTTRVVSAALVGLVVLGLLGGAFVMISGRRNGP